MLRRVMLRRNLNLQSLSNTQKIPRRCCYITVATPHALRAPCTHHTEKAAELATRRAIAEYDIVFHLFSIVPQMTQRKKNN
jgi:hypothetical protein